jgi:diphosphomevalonate decarboxylase
MQQTQPWPDQALASARTVDERPAASRHDNPAQYWQEGVCTATAHANIALVKYWGKKDAALRLPTADSVSMTVDGLYTTTRVRILPRGGEFSFSLDGMEIKGGAADRVHRYVDRLQRRFGLSGPVAVESANHVPTSAGLASSSSAFAALALAFAGAYNLDVDRRELSRMARLGSGSACRSVFGGFARWFAGHDDSSSYAVPIDEHPDIDLRLVVVEVNTGPKPIGSTEAMERVVRTSPYYGRWVEQTMRDNEEMLSAIADADFSHIGRLAQQNALDMHALNLTARPGFTYFQAGTLKAMRIVRDLNAEGVECYFTIDAGANVKILTRTATTQLVRARFAQEMPQATVATFGFGPAAHLGGGEEL